MDKELEERARALYCAIHGVEHSWVNWRDDDTLNEIDRILAFARDERRRVWEAHLEDVQYLVDMLMLERQSQWAEIYDCVMDDERVLGQLSGDTCYQRCRAIKNKYNAIREEVL